MAGVFLVAAFCIAVDAAPVPLEGQNVAAFSEVHASDMSKALHRALSSMSAGMPSTVREDHKNPQRRLFLGFLDSEEEENPACTWSAEASSCTVSVDTAESYVNRFSSDDEFGGFKAAIAGRKQCLPYTNQDACVGQNSCRWNAQDRICEWTPTPMESGRLSSNIYKHMTEQNCGFYGSQYSQAAACWPLDQMTCHANPMCKWKDRSSMQPVGDTCVEIDTSSCTYDFDAWKKSVCGTDFSYPGRCGSFYTEEFLSCAKANYTGICLEWLISSVEGFSNSNQCSDGTINTCSSISGSTCMWNHKTKKCEQAEYEDYPTSCRGFRDSFRLSETCGRLADETTCVANPSCEWTGDTECSDDKETTPHTQFACSVKLGSSLLALEPISSHPDWLTTIEYFKTVDSCAEAASEGACADLTHVSSCTIPGQQLWLVAVLVAVTLFGTKDQAGSA